MILWEAVTGEEVKPVEEKAVQAWEKKARKALPAIALALSVAEKENIALVRRRHGIFWSGKGRNRKFMLLQDLFRMSMERSENMDSYLRVVREKMSALSTIGLKLEDIKLAIILNGFARAVWISRCQSGDAEEDQFQWEMATGAVVCMA